MTLTTNDVRVLRLLVEHGPHTPDEIGEALRYGLGAEPALRRLRPLQRRGMVESTHKFDGFTPVPFDITGEGARALRAADHAAYGRHA